MDSPCGGLGLARRKAWLGVLVLLGTLVVPATPAGAASDPRGDAANGEPDHDILEVSVAETADEVRFTVTVDGVLRAPSPGVEEVRFEFRVVPKALYTPGVSPQVGGTRHTAGLADSGKYGVFRYAGLGYVLPDAPADRVATATWILPKAYLDATAVRRPLAGDWISDITVSTRATGITQDKATHPDVQLAVDQAPGLKLHLRGQTGGAGKLRLDAPDGETPSTAAIARGETLVAEWASAPLERSLRLGDLGAVLWLTTTTSTPVLSDEAFLVDVLAEDADGKRSIAARRAETVDPQEGATTNLFIAPGAPQRMPFRLEAMPDVDRVPSGSKVVLRVTVDGFFAQESGPMLIHFNAKGTDSYLHVNAKPVPRPDRSVCPGGGDVSELPRSRCG